MNEPRITFELSLAEANLVLTALGELPLKVSGELWSKLKQAGDAQVRAAQEPAAAPDAAGLTD